MSVETTTNSPEEIVPAQEAPAATEEAKEEAKQNIRSTVFSVFCDDALRQPILNSIRRYRMACRQMYGVLLASQAAGAEITEKDDSLSLKPDGKRSKAILEAVMNKTGKMFVYEMRPWFLEELYPNAFSFVWDSARADVATVWKAKDPEFVTASKGWLGLQGARGIARFNRRGIGFPVATARPVLAEHTLTLKWDKEIGPVTFRLPRLDGGRYYVWKSLRDGAEGWKLGTIYLSEDDGALKVVMTHHRPLRESSVDPERVCELVINHSDLDRKAFLFSLEGRDAQDVISGEEVLPWLRRMKRRREELERRKAACGSPRRPWGFRKGYHDAQKILSNCSLARERGASDRNHAWTRRIVARMVSWRCGTLKMVMPPSLLFGEPWGWAQFVSFLRYKCDQDGIQLIVTPFVPAQEATQTDPERGVPPAQ